MEGNCGSGYGKKGAGMSGKGGGSSVKPRPGGSKPMFKPKSRGNPPKVGNKTFKRKVPLG